MVSTYLRKKYSSYHIINVIFHFFFQWTYYTANSWGTCSDGKGGVGCGAQETFRACSGTYIHQSTQQPIWSLSCKRFSFADIKISTTGPKEPPRYVNCALSNITISIMIHLHTSLATIFTRQIFCYILFVRKETSLSNCNFFFFWGGGGINDFGSNNRCWWYGQVVTKKGSQKIPNFPRISCKSPFRTKVYLTF